MNGEDRGKPKKISATGAPLLGSVSSWLWPIALLGLALATRLPAFDSRPLWQDELWRAMQILAPSYFHDYFFAPTIESAITSPLYALFVKFLSVFSTAPQMLRLSSLLPGIAAVLLGYALTRRAGGSHALSFLAGGLLAVNENLISYSNEMKPYMFEVSIHLACMYAWQMMALSQRPRPAQWLFCLFILVLTIFSTTTSVFLLPAFGISLTVRFWLEKDIANLRRTIFGFTGLALLVLLLYFVAWRHAASSGMISYWSAGFPGPSDNSFQFIGSQILAIWKAPFRFSLGFKITGLASLSLAAIAVYAVLKLDIRKPVGYLLLFYTALLVTLCAANAMRIWPLGALRPNLFLYGHVIFFLFFAAAQTPSRRIAQLIILCAVAALAWQFHNENKRLHLRTMVSKLRLLGPPIERNDLVLEDFSYGGRAGRKIAANCSKQKTLVLSENFMMGALAYYTAYDPTHRKDAALLNSECVNLSQFEDTYLYSEQNAAARLSLAMKDAPNAWFLYSHYGDAETAALRRAASHLGTITNYTSYENAGYFKLTRPQKIRN